MLPTTLIPEGATPVPQDQISKLAPTILTLLGVADADQVTVTRVWMAQTPIPVFNLYYEVSFDGRFYVYKLEPSFMGFQPVGQRTTFIPANATQLGSFDAEGCFADFRSGCSAFDGSEEFLSAWRLPDPDGVCWIELRRANGGFAQYSYNPAVSRGKFTLCGIAAIQTPCEDDDFESYDVLRQHGWLTELKDPAQIAGLLTRFQKNCKGVKGPGYLVLVVAWINPHTNRYILKVRNRNTGRLAVYCEGSGCWPLSN